PRVAHPGRVTRLERVSAWNGMRRNQRSAHLRRLYRAVPRAGKGNGAMPPSRDDLLAPLDVVPHDVAIQFAPAGEEYPPLRRFRQPVRELDVLVRLVPTRQQEDVDRDPLAGTALPLAQRLGLGPGVRWI